jgi:hypothetical protein
MEISNDKRVPVGICTGHRKIKLLFLLIERFLVSREVRNFGTPENELGYG